MNQFIIENPVLSIVISLIIGAVIMYIISVLAIRMAVEKEVEKALGEEEDLPDVSQLGPSFQPDRLLPIWLSKDECGSCYVYFAEPQKHEAGTGPCSETIDGVYYTCDECEFIDIDELYKDENSSIIYYLHKEFEKMDNLKYGTRKLYLCNRDVVEMINAIPGFH